LIRKQIANKGISMIVVLWIMAILTVLVSATALMTRGDIASTVNLIKRKGALQLAETGSDYFVSMIPTHPGEGGMIQANVTHDQNMPIESGGEAVSVHRVYVEGTTRSFVIVPVPMITNNNPYSYSPGGGQGTYRLYRFTTGGLIGDTADVESPQKVLDVEAGRWDPRSGHGPSGPDTEY
jgi:hypothetical protein